MYSRRPIDLNPAADASAIVAAICASGRARDFFVYKTNSETRIACDCRVKILVTSGRLGITSGGSEPSWSPVVDPLKEIEGLLHNLPDSPWTAYGYVAFDSCKFYHPYDRASHWPLIQFFIPKYEIRIGLQDATVVCPDDDGAVVSVINQAVLKQDFTPEPLQSDSSDYEAFCESVNEAIRLISKGALQKVILSRFIRRQRTIDLLATHAMALRSNNVPRSYCFRIDDIGGVGISPEILVQASGGLITTNPLAGTRPRGANASEDEQYCFELFTNAKEVKEHALSVFVAEQEIREVSSPETVCIHDFMAVKKYRFVQHLSSRVSGTLLAGNTVWDALKRLFPGVTVAGIGKSAALSAIGQLEREPRGIYGGAVGWIDSTQRADFAIAIRSAFQYGSEFYVNAGAGIIAESIAEREYIEATNKMKTMMTCIVLAD